MPTPRIEIAVNGRPALTVEQAAQRYGLAPSSMRAIIARGNLAPSASLDGKKHLYLVEVLDALIDSRPGKGGPGVPRPHKAGTPARRKRSSGQDPLHDSKKG